MKIVTNQNRPRHTDVIRNLLKTATKVWIFVAYLDPDIPILKEAKAEYAKLQ